MTIPQNPQPSRPVDKLSQPVAAAEPSFNALDAIQNEQQLREAFGKFNERSLQLESAYNLLRAQFQQVSAQLHEVYCQLDIKIKETDAAHSYLHNLLEQMSQGVLFVARDGRVLTCNPAMIRWLKAGSDVRGKLFWDLVPDQHFGFSMKEVLQQGQVAPENLSLPEKTRGVEISTKFITYFGDQVAEQATDQLPEGLLLIGRDLSELRRLQTLASQNDRSLDLRALAENMTSEIRVPLQAIASSSSELSQSPASQKQAASISEKCTSIDQILADVLAFAQPLAAKMESIDLSQLLTEIAELANSQNLMQPGQQLNWRGSEPLVVLTDRELLKSSLLNLILNATQAISESGIIELKLTQGPEAAQIDVTDNGKGIPEEHLAKIFSPFFTTKNQSSGLGLAEVHKRISAINAQIDVQSKVGSGSTFSIKFPLDH